MLAKQNEYLRTAYETLEEISADQEKRLEYTARQKALYDYNTLMEESYERGIQQERADGIMKAITMLKNVGASIDIIVDSIVQQYGLTKEEAAIATGKVFSQT